MNQGYHLAAKQYPVITCISISAKLTLLSSQPYDKKKLLGPKGLTKILGIWLDEIAISTNHMATVWGVAIWANKSAKTDS